MKQFLATVWSLCESWGTARAAAHLARIGNIKGAQELYK
jgi:hypothetical protein